MANEDSTITTLPALEGELWRGNYRGNPHNANDVDGEDEFCAVSKDADGWRLAWKWSPYSNAWELQEYEDAATVFLAWAIDAERRVVSEREECAKIADDLEPCTAVPAAIRARGAR